MDNKYLFWSYQSSQKLEFTEEEKKLFQNKYKKDFEQRELYEGDELDDKMRLNGWRNPLFSEITSIILSYPKGDKMQTLYLEGTEKDLLTKFHNMLKNNFQDYTLVGFDFGIILPYLGVRMEKNGFIIPSHTGLRFHNMRPWDVKNGVDLKHYYKGLGDYSFSLEDIAYILDLDYSGIIPYDDEFTYYNSGDKESLKQSAIKKIEAMSKAFFKLNQLPELEVNLVEEKVKDIQIEQPKNWLVELHNVGYMTEEIKEGLRNKIFGGKKKPTKKDLENLFTIIRGVWVQTDFINNNQDNKATIAKKETEIKELLGWQ